MVKTKRKPNLFETDRGKVVFNGIFRNFIDNKKNKLFSRNSSYGADFAERFNLTIRNLLIRPVFEKSDGNWIDVLQTITKQYNNPVHTSTKLTPIQASLKKNEGFVSNNLLDKRKKVNAKF